MENPELKSAAARLELDTDGWTAHEPLHNKELTAGIWELTRGDERIVIKRLVRHRQPGGTAYTQHWSHRTAEPARWNYWAREMLAYRSELTSSFADAGLRAPRCLGVDIGNDDAVLAIEYVDGEPAEHWGISTYADAARCLGAGQARFAGKAHQHEWLSSDFIRTYSTEKPVRWELLDSDAAWNQPLVAENFPDSLREAATTLHAKREDLYALINSCPRTLCHLDFWTKNLIRERNGGFVLLDWAFLGDGAVGEDIGNLVPDAAFDHFIEPDQLPTLRAAVLAAYLDGLRSGGWDGDAVRVEIAMAASAIKYDWLTVLMLERASNQEHTRYGGVDTIEASELYRKRGAAMLDNATQALRALQLSDESN
jgi:Phosphotransferase enzyme family